MNNVTALRVPASHPVFDGHFPGNPIVPGAYLLALVRMRADDWLRSQGSTAIVSGVRSAKFVRPVRPDEPCDLVFCAPAERSLRFSVRADGVVCASGMFVLTEGASRG